jgi:hypothetical protein
MKKIIDFIKSNFIVIKWTAWYFFALWLILRFIFQFDMFSAHYWWKFAHATLHGFGGLVFGLLIYTAIPIYIATTLIVYRKKEYVITIPIIDKIFAYISKIFKFFQKKKEPEELVVEEKVEEQEPEQSTPEYPEDMPHEMRVPYIRAKNHLPLMGAVSVYNRTATPQPEKQENIENESPIPIPTDFDISESFDTNDSEMPMFHDISFDEPEPTPEILENNTTKYFTSKNIEFETYKQFVATEKYVIYEHNDNDFWIMDENVWFAAGKQTDSPINELIGLGKQNGLIPVLYLHSQNIMDIESTSEKFEKLGIRVIKNLDELKI